MTTPLKPAKLGPFLGLSNRRQAFELSAKLGDYLVRAENVDITNAGNLKRRKGFVQAVSGTACHSLWADPRLDEGYYADGTALKYVFEQNGGLVMSTVYNSLIPGRLLAYAHDGVDAVFSDGIANYRITSSGVLPLAPPLISSNPVLAAGSGGSLAPGSYQMCFTYSDVSGREGGATDAQSVVVAANGIITITGLPAAFPTGVNSLVIYLSNPNDPILYRAIKLYAPVASYVFTGLPALTGRCLTRMLKPLPAGSELAFVNGRMHVAAGNYLFYSEPYMPGLYRPESGFIPFVDPVTLLESTPNSIYIGTTRDIFFVTGNIADGILKPTLPYGAIPRSSGQIVNKQSAWFLTERGVVVGDDAGNVVNKQEDEVIVGKVQAGAAMYREQDGMKQIVAGTFGTQPTQAVLGSWAEAEVIHRTGA
jgi:hypothetical protein